MKGSALMRIPGWLKKGGVALALVPFAGKIRAGLAWFNAMPGRKRGVAVVLLGVGTSLRVAGLENEAQAAEALNTILQNVATTSDIAGLLLGIWSLIHPLIARLQTRQAQAANLVAAVQAATPPSETRTRELQATASVALVEARQATVAVEAKAEVAAIRKEEGK